jgi:ribonuclease III
VTGLDWKTRLQELTAELGLGVPEYVFTYVGPRRHARTFTARASVNGELFDPCEGRNRNKAEQAAAAMAWTVLSLRDQQ